MSATNFATSILLGCQKRQQGHYVRTRIEPLLSFRTTYLFGLGTFAPSAEFPFRFFRLFPCG